MRLIDADKLTELCDIMAEKCDGIGESVWHQFRITVEWSPTVDAEPVVRCKDCKWFAEGKWCRNPNNDMVQGGTTGEWYCADGRRREGEDNGAD